VSREDDVLGIGGGREKAADRVVGHLAGEEQPIDGAIERELGGGAREDQQHHVRITPDAPYDRARTNEFLHDCLGKWSS
jgi:hypothetical protein